MSNQYLQYQPLFESLGCEVAADEPMKNHTTFKIGGSADLFVTVCDNSQLVSVVRLCNEKEIPLFVLGNGSNLLVSDKGIRGAVLRLGGEFCDIGFNSDGSVHCGAGAQLSKLCGGGAAFMDAGAYGGEMKDVVVSCEHVALSTGECGCFEGAELDYSYRHSVYSGGGYVITALNVRLEKGDKKEIRAKMDDLMGRRKDKQPLEYPSAGSVFKRPVGYFAGGLIEQCGLKGTRVGGAMVSPKHAGFIVNVGGATCEDVLGLIASIQKTVKEETGVELECEVRKTGE